MSQTHRGNPNRASPTSRRRGRRRREPDPPTPKPDAQTNPNSIAMHFDVGETADEVYPEEFDDDMSGVSDASYFEGMDVDGPAGGHGHGHGGPVPAPEDVLPSDATTPDEREKGGLRRAPAPGPPSLDVPKSPEEIGEDEIPPHDEPPPVRGGGGGGGGRGRGGVASSPAAAGGGTVSRRGAKRSTGAAPQAEPGYVPAQSFEDEGPEPMRDVKIAIVGDVPPGYLGGGGSHSVFCVEHIGQEETPKAEGPAGPKIGYPMRFSHICEFLDPDFESEDEEEKKFYFVFGKPSKDWFMSKKKDQDRRDLEAEQGSDVSSEEVDIGDPDYDVDVPAPPGADGGGGDAASGADGNDDVEVPNGEGGDGDSPAAGTGAVAKRKKKKGTVARGGASASAGDEKSGEDGEDAPPPVDWVRQLLLDFRVKDGKIPGRVFKLDHKFQFVLQDEEGMSPEDEALHKVLGYYGAVKSWEIYDDVTCMMVAPAEVVVRKKKQAKKRIPRLITGHRPQDQGELGIRVFHVNDLRSLGSHPTKGGAVHALTCDLDGKIYAAEEAGVYRYDTNGSKQVERAEERVIGIGLAFKDEESKVPLSAEEEKKKGALLITAGFEQKVVEVTDVATWHHSEEGHVWAPTTLPSDFKITALETIPHWKYSKVICGYFSERIGAFISLYDLRKGGNEGRLASSIMAGKSPIRKIVHCYGPFVAVFAENLLSVYDCIDLIPKIVVQVFLESWVTDLCVMPFGECNHWWAKVPRVGIGDDQLQENINILRKEYETTRDGVDRMDDDLADKTTQIQELRDDHEKLAEKVETRETVEKAERRLEPSSFYSEEFLEKLYERTSNHVDSRQGLNEGFGAKMPTAERRKLLERQIDVLSIRVWCLTGLYEALTDLDFGVHQRDIFKAVIVTRTQDRTNASDQKVTALHKDKWMFLSEYIFANDRLSESTFSKDLRLLVKGFFRHVVRQLAGKYSSGIFELDKLGQKDEYCPKRPASSWVKENFWKACDRAGLNYDDSLRESLLEVPRLCRKCNVEISGVGYCCVNERSLYLCEKDYVLMVATEDRIYRHRHTSFARFVTTVSESVRWLNRALTSYTCCFYPLATLFLEALAMVFLPDVLQPDVPPAEGEEEGEGGQSAEDAAVGLPGSIREFNAYLANLKDNKDTEIVLDDDEGQQPPLNPSEPQEEAQEKIARTIEDILDFYLKDRFPDLVKQGDDAAADRFRLQNVRRGFMEFYYVLHHDDLVDWRMDLRSFFESVAKYLKKTFVSMTNRLEKSQLSQLLSEMGPLEDRFMWEVVKPELKTTKAEEDEYVKLRKKEEWVAARIALPLARFAKKDKLIKSLRKIIARRVKRLEDLSNVKSPLGGGEGGAGGATDELTLENLKSQTVPMLRKINFFRIHVALLQGTYLHPALFEKGMTTTKLKTSFLSLSDWVGDFRGKIRMFLSSYSTMALELSRAVYFAKNLPDLYTCWVTVQEEPCRVPFKYDSVDTVGHLIRHQTFRVVKEHEMIETLVDPLTVAVCCLSGLFNALSEYESSLDRRAMFRAILGDSDLYRDAAGDAFKFGTNAGDGKLKRISDTFQWKFVTEFEFASIRILEEPGHERLTKLMTKFFENLVTQLALRFSSSKLAITPKVTNRGLDYHLEPSEQQQDYLDSFIPRSEFMDRSREEDADDEEEGEAAAEKKKKFFPNDALHESVRWLREALDSMRSCFIAPVMLFIRELVKVFEKEITLDRGPDGDGGRPNEAQRVEDLLLATVFGGDYSSAALDAERRAFMYFYHCFGDEKLTAWENRLEKFFHSTSLFLRRSLKSAIDRQEQAQLSQLLSELGMLEGPFVYGVTRPKEIALRVYQTVRTLEEDIRTRYMSRAETVFEEKKMQMARDLLSVIRFRVGLFRDYDVFSRPGPPNFAKECLALEELIEDNEFKLPQPIAEEEGEGEDKEEEEGEEEAAKEEPADEGESNEAGDDAPEAGGDADQPEDQQQKDGDRGEEVPGEKDEEEEGEGSDADEEEEPLPFQERVRNLCLKVKDMVLRFPEVIDVSNPELVKKWIIWGFQHIRLHIALLQASYLDLGFVSSSFVQIASHFGSFREIVLRVYADQSADSVKAVAEIKDRLHCIATEEEFIRMERYRERTGYESVLAWNRRMMCNQLCSRVKPKYQIDPARMSFLVRAPLRYYASCVDAANPSAILMVPGTIPGENEDYRAIAPTAPVVVARDPVSIAANRANRPGAQPRPVAQRRPAVLRRSRRSLPRSRPRPGRAKPPNGPPVEKSRV